MSEPEIPPALTAEQWRTVRSLEPDCSSLDAVTYLEVALGPEPEPHAAAAALLHDCPYGITGEMVAAIRSLLEWAEGEALDEEARRTVALARAAEARLRALVPAAPESPGGR